MSDEFEDTMPVEPGQPVEDETTEETEEEQTDEVGEFLDGVEQEGAVPAAATIITIQTSGGDTRYVPTETSLTIRDLLDKASLKVGGAVEYWLNGSKLQSADEIIPLGGKLTVVGSVKGG